MEKWESDCGKITLYHADCTDVLPLLSGVDVVVTDPPYGMDYQSGFSTDTLWCAGDTIVGDKTTAARDYVVDWFDGPMLVFGTWKAERPKGTRIVLIWDKGGALGMGDLRLPWKPNHEEIYVIGLGFFGKRDCGSVIQHPPVQSMAKNGRMHPTEKPVGLMMQLLRKTRGTVLDPFMGSGTTGIACIRSGRKFIGIEKDEKYYNIAMDRIQKELSQGRLF